MATQKKTDTAGAGEDRVVVAPVDGTEHGFIGSVRADKDREAFTVAGVTGGTANVSDQPKSEPAKTTGRTSKSTSTS